MSLFSKPLWHLFLFCVTLMVQPAAADDQLDEEVVAQYREFALSNVGDEKGGEEVFLRNKNAQCANCHQVSGMEKSGPNLDGIGQKYSRAELIDHLLDPSKSIKPGYGQSSVLMKDGRLITGRIERSNQLIVRVMDVNGKRINLKRPEIDAVKHSDVSLMPLGVSTSISKQQFADLVAYLQSLRLNDKQGWVAGGKPIQIPHLPIPVGLRRIHPPEMEFQNPVWCGGLPGTKDQLLIVEHQTARIWRFIPDEAGPQKSLFADLGNQIHINGDQGLTSIALHPRFLENGRYFVEHEVREQGRVKTTIAERSASADRLSDSGKPSIRLIEVEQPAGNHNGGCIAFGPDGMLYAGFGDGGPQKDPNGYAQSKRHLLGSFIRIDVDRADPGLPYGIPFDNPYREAAQSDPSIRGEIFATGFREPWRFSFDSKTGDLWVGDVGQNLFEEVCLVKLGENHGWNVREGFQGFSDQYRREGETYTDPLFAYEHGLGFSVTGGHVYRGESASSFDGVYIFGDYNTKRIWGLRQRNGKVESVRDLGVARGGIASFGVGNQGEMYLITYDGEIFEIDFSRSQYK